MFKHQQIDSVYEHIQPTEQFLMGLTKNHQCQAISEFSNSQNINLDFDEYC